jgi:hypothetical protein
LIKSDREKERDGNKEKLRMRKPHREGEEQSQHSRRLWQAGVKNKIKIATTYP